MINIESKIDYLNTIKLNKHIKLNKPLLRIIDTIIHQFNTTT